jgi:hypothetical protein
MTRLRQLFDRFAMDVGAVAGVALMAYGFGLYSPPLLPIALGLGLLVTVRFGSR